MSHVTIPVRYEDSGIRILPGTKHHPPLPILVIEDVRIEPFMEGSRLTKITLPEGRSWVALPNDIFSAEFLKKMGWVDG